MDSKSSEEEKISSYKNNFEQKLKKVSNQELYLLTKKYLVSFHLAKKFPRWKLKFIYNECLKRNRKIYDDALQDALITIHSFDKNHSLFDTQVVDIQRIDHLNKTELEIYLNSVAAGEGIPIFSQISPKTLFNELSKFFISDNVFFCQVSGLSMIEAGINNNSILIVEKVTKPDNNDIVVFAMDGELFVKRYLKKGKNIIFKSENENYPDIVPNQYNNIEILGVVRYVINKPKSKEK